MEQLNINVQGPLTLETALDWWLRVRKNFHKAHRRGFDTLFITVTWSLCKQRNARVFDRVERQRVPTELVLQVLDEIAEWRQAGFGVGGLQRFVRS